jgi:hypothetical protein
MSKIYGSKKTKEQFFFNLKEEHKAAIRQKPVPDFDKKSFAIKSTTSIV